MRRVLPVIIVFLAIAGMADSAYLALDYFHVLDWLSGGSSQEFCAFAGGGCEGVESTSEATILGVPTALVGFGYFVIIVIAGLYRLQRGTWPYAAIFETVLSTGLLFSGYLVFVLLFVIDMRCPFCLAAHAANAAIVVLYALSRRIDRWQPARRRRWAMGMR